jgi:hypothetical protein
MLSIVNKQRRLGKIFAKAVPGPTTPPLRDTTTCLTYMATIVFEYGTMHLHHGSHPLSAASTIAELSRLKGVIMCWRVSVIANKEMQRLLRHANISH